MSERVHQLEDALAIIQAKSSNEPHPLLSDGKTKNRNIEDDDDFITPDNMEAAPSSDVVTAFGMLSMSDHGVSRFFGPTGGTEVSTVGFPTRIPANPLRPRLVPLIRMSLSKGLAIAPHRLVFSQITMAHHHQAMAAGPRSQYAARRPHHYPARSRASPARSRSPQRVRHTACTSSLRATFRRTNARAILPSRTSHMLPGCSEACPVPSSSTR